MRKKMEKLGKEITELTNGKLRLIDHAVLDRNLASEGYKYFLINENGNEIYKYKTQLEAVIAFEEMIQELKDKEN